MIQTFKALFIDIDDILHRASEPGELTIAGASVDELREGHSDLFGWTGRLAEALGCHECETTIDLCWRAHVSDEILRGCLAPLGRRFRGCTPRTPTRETSILGVVRSRSLRSVSYRVLDDVAEEVERLRGQLIVCNPAFGVNDSKVMTQLRDWFAPWRAGTSGAMLTRRFNKCKTQWRRVKSAAWQAPPMAGGNITFIRRRGRPEVAFMPAATARF